MVKVGDVIFIKNAPIYRQYEILDISERRMGAKLTPDFIKEITPESDLEMLEVTRLANSMNRARGSGRPTKKERRDLDNFFSR